MAKKISADVFNINHLLRFWSKVDFSNENSCWEWIGGKDRYGYGVFSIRFNKKCVFYLAHRLSVFYKTGIDPLDNLVCHHCDNRKCVNPDHLFLGNFLDNIKDSCLKGRRASGKRSGQHTHPERTARGSRNGRAKLKEETVLEIRNHFKKGVRGYGLKATSIKFKVPYRTICRIVRRETWVHI